jgi:hypothetical protein
MKQFDRDNVTPESIRALANRGSMLCIDYKVHGFWSSGPVRVKVERASLSFDPLRCEFSISTSAGGRDGTAEPDDTLAFHNLAAAILDACTLVTWLRGAINGNPHE